MNPFAGNAPHPRGARALLACLLTGLCALNAAARTDTWIHVPRARVLVPANVQFHGSADVPYDLFFPIVPFRVVRNLDGVTGRIVINRPAGVPEFGYNYFHAEFEFLMWKGEGADGMSFNYGPDENSYVGGEYENGTTLGLAISFDAYRRGNSSEYIRVRWNGAEIASKTLDMWDASWEDQMTRVIAFYDPLGLTVIVRQIRASDSAVLQERVLLTNHPIPDWRPQPSWKFFFAGRTGSDSMEILLGQTMIRTSSAAPTISGLPDSDTTPEDTPWIRPFTVGDFENPAGVEVHLTSNNPQLIPASGMIVESGNFGGHNRRLRLVPAQNQSGTAVITVAVSEGDQHILHHLTLTVTPVNDPPGLAMLGIPETNEDTPLSIVLYVSDLETPAAGLTVTATSHDPVLIPNSNIQVSGSGSIRSLTLTPAPNRNGSALITIRVSDGVDSSTLDLPCTVLPVNDPPVAGFSHALRFPGAGGVTGYSGLTGNDPHTVEAWVRPAAADSRWLMYLGGFATGGHFWTTIQNSPTNVHLQAGIYSQTPYVTDASLPIGEWSHVVGTWDGTNYSLYVNGILTGRVTPSGEANLGSGQIALGKHPATTSPHDFVGDIDEFRVWNRAITEAEIRRGYRYPLTGREGGLSVYWQFEEASGPTAFDSATLDGHQHGSLGTAVERVQRAPSEVFGRIIANEETATAIYLPGFDMELAQEEPNANLFFEIVTPPEHGSLNDLAGLWTQNELNPIIYTPAPAYNGPDSFTYKLIDNDGAQSQEVTILIEVAELNDDPTLTSIPNQVIEEGTSTGPIPFEVWDEETPDQLTLFAVSSDTRLLPVENIVFGGTGTNRTVTITPAPGEIGTATIGITVTDPQFGLRTESFKVRVEPKPAYALIDLGVIGSRNFSYGTGINRRGWAVGYAQTQESDATAFLSRGLAGDGLLEDLGALASGTLSQALGISDNNVIVGFETTGAGGPRQAFRWESGMLTSIASLIPGTDSIAHAVNASGDIVGSVIISGNRVPWLLKAGETLATQLGNLGSPPGEALDINGAGVIVGYSTLAGGAQDNRMRAFLYDGEMRDLGTLPGHFSSQATAINDDGLVVGWSLSSTNTNGVHQAFIHDGEMRGLGTLDGGSYSRANDINAFGQVVGEADDASASRRAFVHSAGSMRDLNSLIHDSRDLIFAESGWTLERANAINRDGIIVGTGRRNGTDRAFIAVPAWVIGRQIARPEGAVERIPEIELLSGGPGDTAQNSFHWSAYEKKLYAIRPVTARLKWFTSFQDVVGEGTNQVSNTERIEVVGVSVWPRNPTIHVANSPAEVVPGGVANFPYSYQAILYETTGGHALVDPSSKVFNSSATGYSVLYYLETLGAPPNPSTQRPYFDVVRTVTWNDPAHLRERTAEVGETLSDPPSGDDPGHQDYLSKNGFVYFPNAYYDGAGPDRAYDRSTRLGPIIPVNQDKPILEDDLVVVWYRTNRIGVAWPSRPTRYSISWPSDATVPKIIIASQMGSGPLPSNLFRSPRVYNQPDPSLPGYNPNEEHAFIAPAADGSGNVLFALRNDLNAIVSPVASMPYALLKYRDEQDRWNIRVFKVVTEEDPWFFRYAGTAGNEIQPPYPLSVLPLCEASHGFSGPWWEDHQGRIYARAAGAFGGPTNVVVRWFYPLQPAFFYDLDRDGTPDAAPGECLAWLDHRAAGTLTSPNDDAGEAGTPIDVTYRIEWPDAPVLQIGETLMEPKRGLPGVKNWARAQVIYDDIDPHWHPELSAPPVEGLARLYDPLSTRTLKLSGTEKVPDAIARVMREGKEVFPELPYPLRIRLKFDPINRWLEFSGLLDETSFAGEPLLLPNVLSSREAQAIKDLAQGDTAWAGIVDRLYHLTRNPHGVDLDGDGEPDKALRIGLSKGPDGSVVPESLGDLPKALTAGLAGVPPAPPRPGNALVFNGSTGYLDAGNQIDLTAGGFTIEFWIRRTAGESDMTVISQGNSEPGGRLLIAFNPAEQLVFEFDRDLGSLLSPSYPGDLNQWVHWACTYNAVTGERAIYRNGVLVAEDEAPTDYSGSGDFLIGRDPDGHHLDALLDDVRVWGIPRTAASIRRNRAKQLAGSEDGLLRYYRFDEPGGNTTLDHSGSAIPAGLQGGVTRVVSKAPTGIPPRYLTLAENNDPSLAGLPITLHIIRIDDGPYPGDLKPLLPDDVFDERLTIRHSSDFGGDPDQVQFEWWYKPDGLGFDPEDLPVVNADGSIADARGWVLYSNIQPSDGTGVNDITIGQGAESGLLTISDNWFICRYRGYDVGVDGGDVWSDWVGDPSATTRPRAVLAEGWVKRVIRGLNPFDARVRDFHAAAVNTYASMLVQAGPRYEGPIAFNPSADNLNSIGLIEAYTTVLERARSKSIDGTPQVNFNPANNALLLAASRIADLYMLIGNEAYADAQDPTIGFGTDSLEYGSAASSIFAFQNQLDSLLEEELVLLRGRDDRAAGVGAPPVYNRLFWNFTLGEGEVAYQQTYNINDQDFDGFITEADARILYPQGHGDAWGHYLTAIKTYYELLRHPYFTWIPRTESVNVAGVPVEVDFLDERKFARAAAARASTGREIVDLTYRSRYVEDPEGQWQGYKDTDRDRAWGVSEWAWRAGQGAYLDWLTANAILPAVDPNPDHVGIQKIDRTTVRELGEIADAGRAIQGTLDEADAGLNPVGLAKGVVPFDIDPSEIPVEGLLFGRTHFEQVRDRAVAALGNAVRVFNEANRSTQLLRRNQDSVDALTRNAREQEFALKNRLIEIYGYPYAGDIGPGKPYPSGYDGPDLYRYMYIDLTEITGEAFPPATNFTAYFKPDESTPGAYTFYTGDRQGSLTDPETLDSSILEISYPVSAGSYAFAATPEMGKRRGHGELQMALMDIVQANAELKIALQNYDGLIQDIRDALELLEAQHNLNTDTIIIKSTELGVTTGLNAALAIMYGVEKNLSGTASSIRQLGDIMADALPTVVGLANDVTSVARAGLRLTALGVAEPMEAVADNLNVAANAMSLAKEVIPLATDLALTVESQKYEVLQSVKAIEAMIRNEAASRISVYAQVEQIRQLVARYQSLMAEGVRVQEELIRFRKNTAADISEARYQDMTFRIFRNDALSKYRAQFDLAARYVYLAATAYDYESNLLGDDNRSGRDFLTDIVRQRAIGQLEEGIPVAGQPGLADALARLSQNFEVIKTQFGLNNPQVETTHFSLRSELFRIRDEDPDDTDDPSDLRWRDLLDSRSPVGERGKIVRVDNLWEIPEFRRYCRPFAPESAGPQPGIVVTFPTTVTFGLNFFGWPLGGADSSYDSSRFSTRVRSVGVAFSNYDGAGLSQTPRVYIVPIGLDILRSPDGNDFATREWRVVDQALPTPFAIGASTLGDPFWIPLHDSLAGSLASIRRHAGMRAHHDAGFIEPDALTTDTRLIGRSVWNTEWMLIIPGGTFLGDPDAGLDAFISANTDIKIYLQSYSYSGQ